MNEKEVTYVSIREAADLGYMSAYGIRKACKEGLIPCLWSGNRCKIHLDKYMALIREGGMPYSR